MLRRIFVFISILFFSFWNGLHAQFYRGSNIEYSKNRVQYRGFEWSYFRTKYADVYFYQGGEKLALQTAEKSDKFIEELTNFLGFEPRERLYIMVYLSQSDMRQTNIGTTPGESNQIAGSSTILQNKLFVFFEGDHDLYFKQVKEGLAQVAIHQVLYGGSWKDAIREAAFSSFPEWYMKGLAFWLSNPDLSSLDLFMIKELRQRKPQLNFWKEDEARYGGAAFWSFIMDRYGYQVIPNILQMSKFARGVDLGFELIIGKNLEQIIQEFYQFYNLKLQRMVRPEGMPSDPKLRKQLGEIEVRCRKKFLYRDFHESPDQKFWSFVTHERGQYRIWLYDKANDKVKCIVKKEPKLDRMEDLTFPSTCWHPSSKTFCYFYEEKGFLKFAQYSIDEREWNEKQIFSIDKVLYPKFSSDGKNIVFIGVTAGRSDVFVMPAVANSPRALTKTEEDDFSPTYLPNRKVVYITQKWSMNESVSYALMQVDAEGKSKPEEIYSTINELEFSFGWGNEEMGCLERSSEGVRFLKIKWDSVIASIDTTIHYRKAPLINQIDWIPYNIKMLDGPQSDTSWNYSHQYIGHDWVQSHRPLSKKIKDIAFNSFEVLQVSDTLKWHPKQPDKNHIDIRKFLFSEERVLYSKEKKSLVLEDSVKSSARKEKLTLKRSNYELNFASDYSSLKLENNFASSMYQTFVPNGATSMFPGLGLMSQTSISDLLEDYRLYVAVRPKWEVRKTDFAVTFENNKARIDKKTSLNRRFLEGGAYRIGGNPWISQTYLLTQEWKYPFSEFHALSFSILHRWDKTDTLSIDDQSQTIPSYQENNLGLIVQYSLDNTRMIGMNLLEGTRGKVWYEYYQQYLPIRKNTDMHVIGTDFRHYVKLHRSIIAAFRLAGATSLGSRKVVHYLGGVDNWLFQQVDNSTEVSSQMNYAFASFCGPMRGFYVNSRNGNSFVSVNSEVRLPLFSYLSKTPIKSDFIRHFQVIGFGDVGSAWTGASPYDVSNGFNTNSVTLKPVTVTVNSNREPIIYGYGFGLRSKLMGSFVRADWAWGIDDGQILPRVFYLSINMDF